MPQWEAFVVDLVAIGVLVLAIYFPRYRRRDLTIAYVGLNVGVFAVAITLSRATVGGGVGFGLGLFAVLLWLFRRKRNVLRYGDFFLLYVMSYSFVRFFLEFIRADVPTVAGFNTSQVFTLGAFIVAGVIFLYRWTRMPTAGEEPAERTLLTKAEKEAKEEEKKKAKAQKKAEKEASKAGAQPAPVAKPAPQPAPPPEPPSTPDSAPPAA